MAGLCEDEIQGGLLVSGMRKVAGICLLLLCMVVLQAQEARYRAVFYNVENLFDTKDDPETADEEFTPKGAKHWTESRYRNKLAKIARVLKEAGGTELPVFAGLAEVENRAVVADLARQPDLVAGDYGVIHRDSPDGRGIDVAFLYKKALFKPLRSAFFEVSFPSDTTLKTRDILYVAGRVNEETLHFFVCHFPSMYGGEKKSEWKRIQAAKVLRQKIDSVTGVNRGAKIVIMGDFNGKANTEAQGILSTKSSDLPAIADGLYNTGYYLLNEKYGSYRYRGVWQTLDHIMVSGTLLDGRRGLRSEKRLSVFSPSFLLEEDQKYSGSKPLPTYRGPRYFGGFSDHLPVYLDLYGRRNKK